MSISSKKINQMIEEEFSRESILPENVELLTRLAKDIYAMESSIDTESNQKKIEEIKSRIAVRSDRFIIKD